MPFNVILRLLIATNLTFKLLLLALELAEFVLELAHIFFLPIQLTTFLVQEAVLGVQLLVVGFKV